MNLSARGQRDMDGGPEKIEDPDDLAQVRRQARKVHFESIAAAAVATLLAWVIA